MTRVGGVIISPFDEGGSIGRPFVIRSIVSPTSLLRGGIQAGPLLLRDLYVILTMRVCRSAILRFDGTRSSRGVTLGSRTRFHISPATACMARDLAEFPTIARWGIVVNIEGRWPVSQVGAFFHQSGQTGHHPKAVDITSRGECRLPSRARPDGCYGTDVFRRFERRWGRNDCRSNFRLSRSVRLEDSFYSASLRSRNTRCHVG